MGQVGSCGPKEVGRTGSSGHLSGFGACRLLPLEAARAPWER